ncbi:aldehyde dehydrogenase family protein [Alicyclobacillaceae bacterium I2511]|nr:aldehyde dehydrogenase family protein [Alicyclobacillaceae bacterium I2511]
MKDCRNYIGGQWVPPVGGQFRDNVNPANGKVLGRVPLSTAEDVNAAVEAAHTAYKKWRLVPAPQRGEILYRVGTLLKERKEDLARILTLEMGKVLEESRGEVQEAIDMSFYMAGEGRRLFGQTTPSELPNKMAMSVRESIGVVGLITPWNFPIAIASWKSLPALVAGNTVIWKPATETPLMAQEFVKIYEEAGLPAGCVNLVYGSGTEVGDAMVGHPGIRVISFTGSTEVGRSIAIKGGTMLKRVSLEMGGKNAVLVMEDANLPLAVDAILWGAYGTSGQRCTATSRVIVHRAVQQDLEEMLTERIRQLTLGDGLAEDVKVGPIINGTSLDKIDSYVQIGKQEGARLVIGGHRYIHPDFPAGHYYEPTLFSDVTSKMRIAEEEIFGPVISLIPVDSLEEAIAVNNQVSYGLSTGIFTQDVNRVFTAIRDIDTGIVYINAGTTGAEIHLPFGGSKGTGNGHRDSGQAALDVFTEWKAIYVDYSGTLQRAQIDVAQS